MEVSKAGAASSVGRDGSRHFDHHHRFDRNFFLSFLIVCWVGVVMGFMPAVAIRFSGNADYEAPWVLQVHVFAFTAWLLLLVVQIALIHTRQTSVHRRLGLSGVVLIPVMATTALWAEIHSQQFYFDHPPNSQAFFIVPIGNVVAFTVFSTAALLARRKPSAHKRLILLSTSVIVGAAFGRWWWEALNNAFGDGFLGMILNTYTGTNLLLLVAVGYDLLTRKIVHPVYAIGVPALLLAELLVSWIYHAPEWLPVAMLLIGR